MIGRYSATSRMLIEPSIGYPPKGLCKPVRLSSEFENIIVLSDEFYRELIAHH